jgi:ribosomal protein L11 methyltransferase
MSIEGVRWLEVELEVLLAVADDFAAALFEIGAGGVQIIDDTPQQVEEALPDAPPPRHAHYRGHALLIATFEGEVVAEEVSRAITELAADLGVLIAPESLVTRFRTDTGWADKWKAYFEPLQIGQRLWIAPTWRPDFVAPEGALVLRMDPGMAFGTGQHATTSGCLELLVDEGIASRAGGSVLDVGCGSGVLGIVCAQLGAGDVLSIDIDEAAVKATLENAALNGVGARVRSDTTPLSRISGTYSLVLANILAVTLEELADDLLARTERGGTLMLSGILAEQAPHLREHFHARAAAAGRRLDAVGMRERGDWVSFALRVM